MDTLIMVHLYYTRESSCNLGMIGEMSFTYSQADNAWNGKSTSPTKGPRDNELLVQSIPCAALVKQSKQLSGHVVPNFKSPMRYLWFIIMVLFHYSSAVRLIKEEGFDWTSSWSWKVATGCSCLSAYKVMRMMRFAGQGGARWSLLKRTN